MKKSIKFKFALILLFISITNSARAASLEETVKISASGSALCKIYAEEVGGSVQAFIEMNVVVMQIAEKLEYTENLQSYLSEINQMKAILHEMLVQKHGSNINIYNDWCFRFYKGYQNGLAKFYKNI